MSIRISTMQAFRLQFLDAFSQAESHQQEPVCIVRRLYADTTREDEDGASTTDHDHSMKIADFAQTTRTNSDGDGETAERWTKRRRRLKSKNVRRRIEEISPRFRHRSTRAHQAKRATCRHQLTTNEVDDRRMHVWRAAAMKGWADVHVKKPLTTRHAVDQTDMRNRSPMRCTLDDAARN